MKKLVLVTAATAMMIASSTSFAAERSYKRGETQRSGAWYNTMWDHNYPTNWNRDKFRAFDSSASAMKRDPNSIEINDSGVGTETASAYPKHNATAN